MEMMQRTVLTCVLVFFLFVFRALADILRQQGPIPISQYDCENFAAMNGSPKDNTPVRTSSKNHYTPVHTSKSNHGKSTPFPLPLKHLKALKLSQAFTSLCVMTVGQYITRRQILTDQLCLFAIYSLLLVQNSRLHSKERPLCSPSFISNVNIQ